MVVAIVRLELSFQKEELHVCFEIKMFMFN